METSLVISDISTGSDVESDVESYFSNSETDLEEDTSEDTSEEKLFVSCNSIIQSEVNPSLITDSLINPDFIKLSLDSQQEIEEIEKLSKSQTPAEIINRLLIDKQINMVADLHKQDPMIYSGIMIYSEYQAIDGMFWNSGPDFHDLVLHHDLFLSLVDLYGVKNKLLETSEFAKIKRSMSMLVKYERLEIRDVDRIMKLWIGNTFTKRTFFDKIHSDQRNILRWILSCYDYAR